MAHEAERLRKFTSKEIKTVVIKGSLEEGGQVAKAWDSFASMSIYILKANCVNGNCLLKNGHL